MWFIKSRRAQNVEDFETWLEEGVVPTLNVFDNTGDTRATILIIDGTRVNDVRVYNDEIVPTVVARYGTGGGNVPAIFPIQDGRDMKKNQNGLGVGNENDPAYTLDQTGAQAIAVQGTVIGRSDTAGPSKGFGEKNDPMFTLTKFDVHAVALQTVRRLTPLECERLQGFPDNHTEGQADSNRYKQMGNAVAVPVVSWIAQRLAEIHKNSTASRSSQ